jgi:SAM-dependent methyltransferase
MTNWYQEDLAYIHDVGFSNYIQQLIPGVINILQQHLIGQGLIVDLGCGSGLSSQKLIEAGYSVLGIDISKDMLKIANKRVPNAQFQQASLFKVEIPPCSAVISLGECINYLFDSDNNKQTLINLFNRIYNKLIPGGYFIFDVLQPTGNISKTQSFWEGENWMILVEKQEDNQKKTLTRKITTFRQQGAYHRRDDEIHRVQLYESNELAQWLTEVNFYVKIINNCPEFSLPATNSLLIAQKVF